MAERTVWTQVRNITTVLSLANVVSVYVEKTVAGRSSISGMLRSEEVRVRLWATAILLLAASLLTLTHLLLITRDLATDLQPGASRQRLVMLCFAGGQIVVAAVLAILLLVFG